MAQFGGQGHIGPVSDFKEPLFTVTTSHNSRSYQSLESVIKRK
jgi:hypothetical protein